MALSKELTRHSYPEIGAAFGKDHTTVLHSVRKVEQMIKDLELILCAGEASHVPLLQTAMTHKLMHAAVMQGDTMDDYAAIIKVVERGAGLPEHGQHDLPVAGELHGLLDRRDEGQHADDGEDDAQHDADGAVGAHHPHVAARDERHLQAVRRECDIRRLLQHEPQRDQAEYRSVESIGRHRQWHHVCESRSARRRPRASQFD